MVEEFKEEISDLEQNDSQTIDDHEIQAESQRHMNSHSMIMKR